MIQSWNKGFGGIACLVKEEDGVQVQPHGHGGRRATSEHCKGKERGRSVMKAREATRYVYTPEGTTG